MSILNLFRRRGSAPLARERLQILLSHERTAGNRPDLLAILHEEIYDVARQITVERENVRVRMDRGARSRHWRSMLKSRIWLAQSPLHSGETAPRISPALLAMFQRYPICPDFV